MREVEGEGDHRVGQAIMRMIGCMHCRDPTGLKRPRAEQDPHQWT